jgi:dihydroorotate dehydrogenase electron transfer subunit
MKQLNVKILENKKIGGKFYKMRLESVYLARSAKPGQFLEVKCSDGQEPLLRRPLGVHRITGKGIDILYEVVGKGTELLARKSRDELLDVIGPLGNGFYVDQKTEKRKNGKTILVAGGIGIAPLLSLAEALFAGSPVNQLAGLTVLIGACKKEHILCEKDFKKLGAKVLVSTEDGSKGYKGLVTEVLKNLLRNTQYASHNTTLYACGPVGMLKAVSKIAKDNDIPCQVSLEEHMACGVGVCLGCPVKVKTVTGYRSPVTEYKMVCKDGPVFDAAEIIW